MCRPCLSRRMSLLNLSVVATLCFIAGGKLVSAHETERSSLAVNMTRIRTTTSQSDQLCPAVAECLPRLDAGQECSLLPVPERSVLEPVLPGTFLLTTLRKGAWVYNDGTYLTLLFKEGRNVAFVDFPDSLGSNKPDGSMTRLTDAAEQILNGTVPKKIHLVYSHAHYDHIGGATRFFNYMRTKHPFAEILIWGTSETRRMIRNSSSKRAVVPNQIVGREGDVVRLGKSLKLKLDIIGGHTAKDLLVFVPKVGNERGILLHVDVVFPRWATFVNLGITEDVTKYIQSHEEMLKLDFDVFVGGHLNVGDRRDVEDSLHYVRDLLDAAAESSRNVTVEDLIAGGIGNFSDPTSVAFGNVWYAFVSVSRKLEVDGCYRIMLEKWGCKLGGLDLMLRSHCFVAVSYNLLES